VNGSPVEYGSSIKRSAAQREGELADGPDRDRAVVGDEEEPVAVETEDGDTSPRSISAQPSTG